MILIVANTIIGRPGNVGFRLGKVIQKIEKNEYFVLARGIDVAATGRSLGWIGFLCRALNGIRRYVFPRFNSRRYDILLFNISVLVLYYTVIPNKEKVSTVLLCESSAFLSKFFKRKGLKIVVDVPIAPSCHIQRLEKRGVDSGLRFNKFLDRQEKNTLEQADCVIVPSEYIARLIREDAKVDKVFAIPFGVSAPKVVSRLGIHKKKEKNIKFGFLGNISTRKGCKVLLKAWDLFDSKGGASLVMQGKVYPEMSPYLKQEYIEYRSFGKSSEFFLDIDVLIFPSFMEGSAKVIYESVSNGVPVFASEYSGAPYFDGYGIREIKNITPEGLVEVMKEIVCNGACKLDEEYVSNFRDEYSWDNYSKNISKVLA